MSDTEVERDQVEVDQTLDTGSNFDKTNEAQLLAERSGTMPQDNRSAADDSARPAPLSIYYQRSSPPRKSQGYLIQQIAVLAWLPLVVVAAVVAQFLS